MDDGSTDGSARIIRRFVRATPGTRALFHPVNQGIGRTLRDGYLNARYENVCAVPADGQFDVEELLPFARVDQDTFVSFFRKNQVGYSPYRRLLSRTNRAMNRLVLGMELKDVNWVKVYKRSKLSKLDLRLQSSLIESEICAKLLADGARALQVPSIYHRRVGGKAKGASPRSVYRAAVETIKLAWVFWTYRLKPGR